MGKREDYIKEILSGYETPVDIPSTWSDLESLLDKPKKIRKPLWLWFAAFGIMLSLLAAAYFLGTTTDQAPMASLENESNYETDPAAHRGAKPKSDADGSIDLSEIAASDEDAIGHYNNAKDSNTSHNTVQNNKIYDYKNNQTLNTRTSVSSTGISKASPIIKQNAKQVFKTDIVRTNIVQSNDNTPAKLLQDNRVGLSLLQSPVYLSARELKPLAHRSMVSLAGLNPSLVAANSFSDSEFIVPVKSGGAFMASFDAGLLRHRLVYDVLGISGFNSGNSSFDLSESSKLELSTIGKTASVDFVSGYNFAASLGYTFGNGIVIKSGLQFQNFSSRIQGEYLDDSNAEILDDIVLFKNSEGESYISLGEREIEFPVNSSFSQLNTIQNWKLPLDVGYNIKRNKIQLIATVGLGLNMITGASGRYFDSRTTVREISENNLYRKNRLLQDIHAELQLHRSLSNNFNVYASMRAGKFLSSVANDEFSNTNFNYTSFNLGVSRNF